MSHWKSKLIDAYRLSTGAIRYFRYTNMARKGEVPVIILFYHRIANENPNDWTMTREQFTQQIDWFQENFDLVDLEECQRRISSGNNSRPTLSITFDDGYSENCQYALPMLIERRIPVTYFVTTYHLKHQKPFPHDVERSQPLAVHTIEALKSLDLAGIEIGAHSRTHADMGSIDDEAKLVDEVVLASLELESMIGRKIRYFAFPFGQRVNLNTKVFSLLKSVGFRGVCSAYGGWNEIGEDSFHLQRLHGDPNFSRMKNWLTFDPRIAKTKRYNYELNSHDENLLQTLLKAHESSQGVIVPTITDLESSEMQGQILN